MSTPGLQTAM